MIVLSRYPGVQVAMEYVVASRLRPRCTLSSLRSTICDLPIALH
jgi:hypothetical protein